MKQTGLVLGIILGMISVAVAQQDTVGHIEVNHSIWGLKIKEDSQRIKLAEAMRRMEGVPQAYETMRTARSAYLRSQWVGYTSAALIVYSIATKENKSEMNIHGREISHNLVPASIGIAGLGLAIYAISLEIRSVKKMQDAASIYNQNRLGAVERKSPSWQLAIHPTGIGISMTF